MTDSKEANAAIAVKTLVPAAKSASTLTGALAKPENALVASGAHSAAVVAALPRAENRNLSTTALTPFLVPQRLGDPLGLGIRQEDRPPAPEDPDIHDIKAENESYSRSFLSKKKQKALDEEIKKNGYMSIGAIRDLVMENTTKESLQLGIDPEIMMLIDSRTNIKIFIAGDNIYSRNELYDHFPFHELGVQPEAIFAQQEIGIFEPRKWAIKDDFEYQARDVDDETVEFITLEDLVGQAARKGYEKKRAPIRIAKTKVYVGRERWTDFELLHRTLRSAIRVQTAQIAYGGGSSPVLSALMGAPTGPSPLLLTNAAQLEAEQKAREEQAIRREEELARREAEQRIREEEERKRAEEQRKREAEISARIEADLARVEKMLHTMNEARRAREEQEQHYGEPAAATGTTAAPAAAATATPTAEAASGGAAPEAVPDPPDSVEL